MHTLKLAYRQIQSLLLVVALATFPACGSSELPLPHACRDASPGKIRLSEEHLTAVERRREIVLNFDVMIVDPKPGQDARELAHDRLAFTDDPEIRIDSIWWNWGEGNAVPYPSQFLPRYNHPGFQYWFDHEIDIVEVFLAETHARGIECFFSMRMNGADNDPQFVPGLGTIMDMTVQGESDSPGGDLARGESGKQINNAPKVYRIPLKEEHPEWLFHTQWTENGYWNYAHEGVREYYLRNLREVAERYDFDGIELDFARGLVLPPGEAWQNRHHVTDFMRQLRRFLLEVEARREKPFLLAARVPENLMGCHFDGLDVETWAQEQLVDILVLGCRSLEVEVAAFRQITAGKTIRLFPALDDHHSSDGYCTPEIEVFRGVVSNWRQQGADGLQTFNFAYGPRGEDEPWWEMHRQFYRDISDPDRWERLAKTFVVQRHGGGHGTIVHPNPEDWSTPRAGFANTNLLSPLPVPLDNLGKADVLLALRIGDDLQAHADRVESLEMWLLLHDSNLGTYQNFPRYDQPSVVGNGQIKRAVIRDWFIPEREGKSNENFLYNSPPQQGIENQVEVRVNNLLLPTPEVRAGWLVFPVAADMCALGENLVGVRVKGRDPSARPLSVEKLELRLRYREP